MKERLRWKDRYDVACFFFCTVLRCQKKNLCLLQLQGHHAGDAGYAKQEQLVNNTKGQLSNKLMHNAAEGGRDLPRACCHHFVGYLVALINIAFPHVLKTPDNDGLADLSITALAVGFLSHLKGGQGGQHLLHTLLSMSNSCSVNLLLLDPTDSSLIQTCFRLFIMQPRHLHSQRPTWVIACYLLINSPWQLQDVPYCGTETAW